MKAEVVKAFAEGFSVKFVANTSGISVREVEEILREHLRQEEVKQKQARRAKRAA